MITEEQRKARKQGIGGTDASAILGVNPYCSIMDVWLEKTGKIEPEDISAKPCVYWGNKLESIIIDEYMKQTGNVIMTPDITFTHKNYPWMIGHLDGLDVNESRILECKTAGYNARKDWGKPGTGEIPLHYAVQVQHYLAVTGNEIADIAVLIAGSDFRIYTIERDEAIIKHLIEEERKFWHEHVLRDVEPVENMKVRRRKVA